MSNLTTPGGTATVNSCAISFAAGMLSVNESSLPSPPNATLTSSISSTIGPPIFSMPSVIANCTSPSAADTDSAVKPVATNIAGTGVGVGVGVAVGVAVGVGVDVGVAVGVAVAVAVGVGVAVAVAVGVAVGVRVGVAVGKGDGVAVGSESCVGATYGVAVGFDTATSCIGVAVGSSVTAGRGVAVSTGGGAGLLHAMTTRDAAAPNASNAPVKATVIGLVLEAILGCHRREVIAG